MDRSSGRKLPVLLSTFFMLANLTMSPLPANAAAPAGAQSLRDFLSKPGHTMTLVGDGETTSHCQAILKDAVTGKTGKIDLNSVCIETLTKKPPQTAEYVDSHNLQYTVGAPAPVPVMNLMKAAKVLDGENAYKNIASEGTVAQLSIWAENGNTSGLPADKLSPKVLEKNFLKEAKLDPRNLNRDEEATLHNRIATLWSAVDQTRKLSNTLKPEDPRTQDEPGGGTPENPGGGDPQTPGTDIVYIPPNTTFVPNESREQIMMNTQPTYVSLRPDDGIDGPPQIPGTTDGGEIIPLPKTPGGGAKAGGPQIADDPKPVVAKKKCSWSFLKAVVYNGQMGDKEKKNLKKLLDALTKAIGAATAEVNAVVKAIDAIGPGNDAVDVDLIYLCKDDKGNLMDTKVIRLDNTDNWQWAAKMNFAGNDAVKERQKVIDKKKPISDCCAGK